MAVVGFLALWRGRREEQLACVGILAGWAFSMVMFRAATPGIQWGMLAADLALFGLYLWIALKSPRFWPLFVSAFALLLLVTHVAHAAAMAATNWAYLTAELVWSYLLLVTIGYASWTAPRRHAELSA